MKYESRSRALGLAGKNEMAASIKSETRAQMAKVNPSADLSLTVLGKELSLDCPLCLLTACGVVAPRPTAKRSNRGWIFLVLLRAK